MQSGELRVLGELCSGAAGFHLRTNSCILVTASKLAGSVTKVSTSSHHADMKEGLTPEQFQRKRPEGGVEDEPFFEQLRRADAVIVLGADLKWSPGDTKEQRELYPNKEVRAGIQSKMRAIAAFELLRNGVVHRIIFTGGVMENEPFGKQLAEQSREYTLALLQAENERRNENERIPESSILIAGDSKGTAEDVEYGLQVARDVVHAKNVYIETLGFHIGRATLNAEHAAEQFGFSKDDILSISAEDVLRARSSHYEDLLKYFEPPHSVIRQPQSSIQRGLKEFIHRAIIRTIDPGDKIARERTRKERGSNK